MLKYPKYSEENKGKIQDISERRDVLMKSLGQAKVHVSA